LCMGCIVLNSCLFWKRFTVRLVFLQNMADKMGIIINAYGYRSFAVSAPALWNSQLSNIRNIDCLATFKTELKTYLFKLAFNT